MGGAMMIVVGGEAQITHVVGTPHVITHVVTEQGGGQGGGALTQHGVTDRKSVV